MIDNEKLDQITDNEIPIEDLPVTVKAYEDENGFAIVLTSEDARIGDSSGHLVKNFLVRILRGDVPKVLGAHPVAINEKQTRNVEVADAVIDEKGRLFVTDAASGAKHRAVQA